MSEKPWTERETLRLREGHYKPLPWGDDPTLKVPPEDPRALHFPHISKESPELMAYTQSPDKGERDVKTKIKPGTYLKKFFSDRLGAPAIAQYAARFRATAESADTTLHIATTPEECVAAYRANTGSCVSYASGGYLGPVHPASVYGSPDPQYVTVAYLKRGDRITAKALINRPRKQYQSLHGDTATLTTLLNAQGYTGAGDYNGRLVGLYLRAYSVEGHGRPRFVAPCIDGHSYARHDAAEGRLVLLSGTDWDKLPAAERITLGYYTGLTA